MADNNVKPSLSQVSHDPDSEPSEHHSTGSFATLPSGSGDDSAMGNLDTAIKVEYNSSTPTNNRRINIKRQISSSEGARYMLVSRNPSIINHNDQQPKRPRGRPRGSKNKPKPKPKPKSSIIAPTKDTTLIPIVIDVHPGSDVVESLINVARTRNMGIYIHSGVGLVSYAVIRKPPSYADIHVEGPATMVALHGSYFGSRFVPLPLPQLHLFQTLNPPPSPTSSLCSSFAIVLSGADALAYGGIVTGKIIAAEIVRVVAILVKKPEFIRYPLSDVVIDNNNNGGGDDNDDKNNNNNNNEGGSVGNGGDPDAQFGGGEDNKRSTANNCGVNYSTLPYISAAYGFVGVGTCVCNVSVMQCWNHAITHHTNHDGNY